MRKSKYTDEEFILAHKNAKSIAEILRRLNLNAFGSNYQTINKKMKELGLEKPVGGQSWNKGKRFPYKRDIRDYLENKVPISSHSLRKRLIDEGYKEYKCESCLNVEWLGKPISLELEHIDGDHYNNLLKNLLILCPNCHAQTETYRGKNINNGLRKSKRKELLKLGPPVLRPPIPHKTKINWPNNEELLDRLSKSNYTRLGKELGISDNAIRKRLKSQGLKL